MKIAKPLLAIITPLGIAIGVREAYRVSTGLLVLMLLLLSILSVATWSIVRTIRRERSEEEARRDGS